MGGRRRIEIQPIGWLAAIVGGVAWKIRLPVNSEESGEARLRTSQLLDSTLPRKASKRVHLVTVP